MKINTTARIIAAGGMLTVFAILFQLAPVLTPGFGLAVSPLATLPVALASIVALPLGLIVYFAAAFVILLVSAQEAVIFLLATGLLGIALGAGYQKKLLPCFGISAAALFTGLMALTHLALIPVFGGLTPHRAVIQVLVYLLFSALYSAIWMIAARLLVTTLEKHHLIERPAKTEGQQKPPQAM